MDRILNTLYKPRTDFILCGDININYMERNNHRKTFDNLLSIYNLVNTVNFLTRIAEKTTTIIDNIFIDAQRTFNIAPHINPYPTAFPYGNGTVLHFYQQQESSTTKTVHKVIKKGLKAYV